MRHYRQGDVLIVTVGSIPQGTQPVARDRGRIVLAYGEATGHAHAIHDRNATLSTITGDEVDDRFLEITGAAASLVHEEHDTITLPPGAYRVRRQREYTPEAPVMVAD